MNGTGRLMRNACRLFVILWAVLDESVLCAGISKWNDDRSRNSKAAEKEMCTGTENLARPLLMFLGFVLTFGAWVCFFGR